MGCAVTRCRERAWARECATRQEMAMTHQQRQQDEVDQRESRLRAASFRCGRGMLYRGADRSMVLDRVRATVPGFAEERYETALSDAVAGL